MTKNLSVVNPVVAFRREHTSESVNHVAFVPIYDIAIRGLHFQTIACRPGTTAENSPIAAGPTAAAFVSVGAPFPNVAPEIVEA